VLDRVLNCAKGGLTKSEAMGHREFILTHKTFDPSAVTLGPSCFPVPQG